MVLTCDLTKIYEEVIRGKASDIRSQIRERQLKDKIAPVISVKTREKVDGKKW